MSEMKPCPFCGKEDLYFEQDEEGETNIVCDWCEYKTRIFQTIGDAARWWNTRPIEDGLRKRIAELEGLVDELKPYRDGYDPEEVFPPEGEWVWLRDCDDNVEVMGYSQKEKCYWNYEGSRMPDDGDIVRWYPIGKLPEVQE